MDVKRLALTSLIAVLTMGLPFGHNARSQGIDIRREREVPPPPPTMGPPRGDELGLRMAELRGACWQGDRGACVRFGVIIGQHQERVAEWRRDHPDFFFYEEEHR